MTTGVARGHAFLGLGIAAAIVAVIAGVRVAGTPGQGRAERLDRIRASDLRAIMTSIDTFWRRHERLPDSLGELVRDPRVQIAIEDPDKEQEYEYRIIDDDSYELCAVFERASIPEDRIPDAFWLHDQGRHCFPLDALEP
ncbi:MAG: hypothetical protein ACE5HT_17050 [Gemmatimonadales bacterium]